MAAWQGRRAATSGRKRDRVRVGSAAVRVLIHGDNNRDRRAQKTKNACSREGASVVVRVLIIRKAGDYPGCRAWPPTGSPGTVATLLDGAHYIAALPRSGTPCFALCPFRSKILRQVSGGRAQPDLASRVGGNQVLAGHSTAGQGCRPGRRRDIDRSSVFLHDGFSFSMRTIPFRICYTTWHQPLSDGVSPDAVGGGRSPAFYRWPQP